MDRSRLGRGIASLIPGAETAQILPIDKIKPNPFQPRTHFDPEKFKELVDSIQRHGVLEPVLVRPVGADEYQLIAGERRYRAAKEAGMSHIPAVFRQCDDAQMVELALVENVQREDISPIESAVAYQRLMKEFHWTQEQVAQRVGKSRVAISNTMRLLSLPIRYQESVDRGEVSEGHARALLMLSDQKVLDEAWDEVRRRGLSVRETERMVRMLLNPPKKEPPASTELWNPELKALEEALQNGLGTRVHIEKMYWGWRLSIDLFTEEELMALSDQLLAKR